MNPIGVILIFGAVMSLFVALLPNLLWAIGALVVLPAGKHLRYAPFGYASLVLAGAVILALAYGFLVGRWNFCVRDVEYHNDNLPSAFCDFRIVHISDLHLNTFDDAPQRLQTIVDSINARRPDLVCFTGDLVSLDVSEVEPYTGILKGIRAKYGVLSVFGNHDFLIYNRNFTDGEERLRAVEELARYEREELGWTLLRDSIMVITAPDGGMVTIIGADFENCNDYMYQAMESVDGFTVMLTHDPGHWDTGVLPFSDIPLTLSGHTHIAQISIFGFSPASWIFKRTYGMYTEGNQTIYVNPGLGCTVPFRIGARPEITVITLK